MVLPSGRLADGVTWTFGTGSRQTKPLDGMFSKQNPEIKDCLTGARCAAATPTLTPTPAPRRGAAALPALFSGNGQDPPVPCTNNNALTPVNPAVYDHGIVQGASDALDVQTLWIFAAVRPLHQPQTSTADGRAVFATYCASCHGGAKWTKSQIFHRDNPAAVAQNGALLDPGVTRFPAAPPVTNLANELFSFTCNDRTINYLEKVGTFDINNPIEVRDNAAASTSFGVNGFNVPSLLSINYHTPYLHRGQAQTLERNSHSTGWDPMGRNFRR